MRNPVVNIVLTALAAWSSGCIDADPSVFPVDAGTTVPPTDVDLGDAEADAVDPIVTCRACIEGPEDPGPGCAGFVAPCKDSAQCSAIYECCYDKRCWLLGTQQDAITCSIPCFVANGVTNPADPIVMLSTPILQCVLSSCQTACGGGPS